MSTATTENICALESEPVDHPLPASGEFHPVDLPKSSPESEPGPTSYRQLTKKAELELSLHRRRGHLPFDSRCTHCQRSRSVIRHPRVADRSQTPQGHKMMLVQADHMFIESHKFLVISDSGTGLLGVASIDSNPDRTLADIKQYFRQLGINESSATTVEVLVDSEPALSALLRRTGLPLQIKAAAPQAHETVGLAERTVRRFKEMIACIRSDMRSHGYDLTCNSECYHCVLQYIAQSHNHFGLGATSGQYEGLNSRRSPLELILQKDRPSPTSSLFGSVVHAQVPDSLASAIPEATRFIPASGLPVHSSQ